MRKTVITVQTSWGRKLRIPVDKLTDRQVQGVLRQNARDAKINQRLIAAMGVELKRRGQESTYEGRKARSLEILRIVKRSNGFQVEQFDLDTGAHVEDWAVPFKTRAAAEIFMDDLAGAAAEGNPNDVCCASGYVEAYERAGEQAVKNEEVSTEYESRSADLDDEIPF